jgi:hypothetical protein
VLSKDSGQRSNEPLTRSIYQRGLDPLMIAQHQLLGVGMQIYLLVYPTLRWTQAPTRAPDSHSGPRANGARLGRSRVTASARPTGRSCPYRCAGPCHARCTLVRVIDLTKASPSHGTGLKRQDQVGDELPLIARICIRLTSETSGELADGALPPSRPASPVEVRAQLNSRLAWLAPSCC